MRVVGHLVGLFSFDVGYEIDLERARACLTAAEREDLARRRPAPASLAYTTPPLRVPMGTRVVHLQGDTVTATVGARIHDLGAVTIVLRVPLAADVEALPALTATLADAGPLELAAREELEALHTRLRPAITKPGLNPFVEDYYVLQVDRLEPDGDVDALLAAHGPAIASALRCEPGPLSADETAEVLRTRLSYHPADLVVTEWNVALVVDPVDYADTVNVLEYLNVQPVELRYYDTVLDRHVQEAYGLTARRTRAFPLANRRTRRAIDELAEIRVDVAAIVERLGNALKLSGDLYLAKLYQRTAPRLALQAWAGSVDRKLEVLDRLYGVLASRIATARAEALEMAIVVLIVIELVLALVRHA
jgi:hypothetical protein